MQPRYINGVTFHEILEKVIWIDKIITGRIPDPIITQNVEIIDSLKMDYTTTNQLLYVDNADKNIKSLNIEDFFVTIPHQTEVIQNVGTRTASIHLPQDIDTISNVVFNDLKLSNNLRVENYTQLVPSTYTQLPTYKFEMYGDTLNDVTMNIRKSNNTSICPIILLENSRGTINSPTNVLNNDLLGIIYFSGYDSNAYETSSLITSMATEDHTVTSHGTRLEFHTTENGTINTEVKMSIDHDGVTTIYSTVDATSSTTGSLIIGGGIGISKDIHVGGNMDVDGYLDIAGGIEIGGNMVVDGHLTTKDYLLIESTIQADILGNSAFKVLGGAIINKSLFVKDKLFIGTEPLSTYTINVTNLDTGLDDFSDVLQFYSAEEHAMRMRYNPTDDILTLRTSSTSTDVIALYPTQFTVEMGTDSSSSTTGSLVAYGGVGIYKNLNVGGDTHIYSTTQSSSFSSGALIVDGGVGIQYDLRVAGTVYGHINGTITTVGLALPGTDLSTSTSTGTLQVCGGAGLGQLYVEGETTLNNNLIMGTNNITSVGDITSSGIMQFTSTIDSTSSDTGAVIISGGVGIAKAIFGGSTLSTHGDCGMELVTDGASVLAGSYTKFSTDYNIGVFWNRVYGSADHKWEMTVMTTDEIVLYNRTDGLYGLRINNATGLVRAPNGILIQATSEASTITTGSFNVYGGAGIVKQLYVGGETHLVNDTDAISTDSGALQTLGGAGITKDLYVGGTIHGNIAGTMITGTDDSTSTDSGALQVLGGVGIAKNLYVGGVTDSTSGTTGALVVTGGVGVSGNISVGDAIFEFTSNTVMGIMRIGSGISPLPYEFFTTIEGHMYAKGDAYVDGIIQTHSTIESTSINMGALKVAGGTGIEKNLYVGGETHIVNATGSSSITTGALVVGGGAGIAEKLYVGGDTHIESATSSTSLTTGALVVSGGLGVASAGRIGGELYIDPPTELDYWCQLYIGYRGSIGEPISYVSIQNVGVGLAINSGVGVYGALSCSEGLSTASTIDATSISLGALTVEGGAAIAMNLYVGGEAHIESATGSTSATTGALVVGGGMGVSGDIYLGAAKRLILTDLTGFPPSVATCSLYYSPLSGLVVDKSIYTDLSLTASIGNFVSTSDSSGTDNGAVVVNGGVGIGLKLYVGGEGHFINNIQSTSSSTGALQVTGGVGIGKELYLGSTSATKKKLVLYDSVGNDYQWYGLGIQSSELRYQINGTTAHHSFYSAVNATLDQELMRIEGNLGASVGVSIKHTTNASGTNTGAFTVVGGVGIGGKLYTGGALDVASTIYSHTTTNNILTLRGSTSGNVGVSMGESDNTNGYMRFVSDNTLHVGLTSGGTEYDATKLTTTQYQVLLNTISNATNAGALTVLGGVGVGGRVYATNMTCLTAPSVATDVVRKQELDSYVPSFTSLTLTSTTDSGSTNSGALQVRGGAGIAQKLYVGGEGHFIKDLESSGTNTGSLTVSGGVGIAKKLYVGGITTHHGLYASDIGGTYIEGTYGNVHFQSSGSTSTNWNINTFSGLQLFAVYPNNGNYGTRVFSTVESSGTNTGALTVSGGAGIGGKLNVNGNITGLGSIYASSEIGANIARISGATYFGNATTGLGSMRWGTLEGLNITSGTTYNVTIDPAFTTECTAVIVVPYVYVAYNYNVAYIITAKSASSFTIRNNGTETAFGVSWIAFGY
jgi:hypothetical protein